jgi:glutamyl-tRNA reductase
LITVVGLSHQTAPIDVRERLAVDRKGVEDRLGALQRVDAIGEVLVLSTCNRVEVYAAPPRTMDGGDDTGRLHSASRAVVEQLAAWGGPAVEPHLRTYAGSDALRHLFRVAGSLDSMVLGEPQILGQLKDAIELARTQKTLGPTLGKAMTRALFVGKRVRTETQIGAGQVSVSSVAVETARQIFGELEGRVALLVGAGEMAESSAKLLAQAGARLLCANRSPERATKLAAEVGGTPRAWSELDYCLIESDIVITSTSSPDFVVRYDAVKAARKARRGRSIFLIDIAVPRDVDPRVNELDNVYLYDVDNLQQAVADSRQGRAAEAEKAERIVEGEVRAFETWSLERALTPTIVGLRARTRALLAAELERSLAGKLRHLGDPEKEALERMIDAATSKLCHHPTARIKEMATDPRVGDYVEALRDLFNLPEIGDSEEPEESVRPAAPSRAPGKP